MIEVLVSWCMGAGRLHRFDIFEDDGWQELLDPEMQERLAPPPHFERRLRRLVVPLSPVPERLSMSASLLGDPPACSQIHDRGRPTLSRRRSRRYHRLPSLPTSKARGREVSGTPSVATPNALVGRMGSHGCVLVS